MRMQIHPDLGSMPVHWGITELGEVANVTKLAGYEFTKHFKYIEDGEIIALRSLNVVDGQLDVSNIKRIARSVSEELPRSKLFINDLLLTYTGSKLGDTALIDANDQYHLAPNVCRLRANEAGDAYFLYVFLRSKVFAKLLDNYKVGSGQPTVPMKNIRKISLPWPSKKERENIAKIFSSLTDKIELNRQTNQTLEHIAQAIFKSWFVGFEPTRAKVIVKENGGDEKAQSLAAQSVICGAMTLEQLSELSTGCPKMEDKLHTLIMERFRSTSSAGLDKWTPESISKLAEQFPNALSGSELGEIPEGWPVFCLGDVITELRRGISPKYTESNGIQVINQRCIRNHSINFKLTRLNDPEKRKTEGREVELGDVLVNSTGVGTLGRLAPVRFLSEPAVFDSHVTVVRADTTKISKSFLYGLMLDKESFIEASGAGSTGQTELRKQVLEDIKFPMPPFQLGGAFEGIVGQMNEQRATLESQQESLSETRDALLPKLLSGVLSAKTSVG